MKQYYVYIITNTHHTVLYTGMTGNLSKRLESHFNKYNLNSFSARYNLNKLVYIENFNTREDALRYEYKIKAGSRKNKIKLIENINPNWDNLIDL